MTHPLEWKFKLKVFELMKKSQTITIYQWHDTIHKPLSKH